MIRRYGQAIEYDLLMSPARLDLATEWRRRRWRRLLSIIDQLPRESRYFEARINDDESVALAMEAEAAAGERANAGPVRRMADWSAEVELLTIAVNRLGEIAQAVAMLGGAKPGRLPPAPVPTTAFERVRRRKLMKQHKSLVSRLLPHRAGSPD